MALRWRERVRVRVRERVRSRCCSCRGTNCLSYYHVVETITGSSAASLTSDTASLDRQHQQPRTGPYLEHVGCAVLLSPLWHNDGGWWKEGFLGEVVKGWCQKESHSMAHRLLLTKSDGFRLGIKDVLIVMSWFWRGLGDIVLYLKFVKELWRLEES